jgi:hypothetical protein
MADSTMNESLMATIPTPSALYQQGSPRRVTDESMISSAIRKKPWSYTYTYIHILDVMIMIRSDENEGCGDVREGGYGLMSGRETP